MKGNACESFMLYKMYCARRCYLKSFRITPKKIR